MYAIRSYYAPPVRAARWGSGERSFQGLGQVFGGARRGTAQGCERDGGPGDGGELPGGNRGLAGRVTRGKQEGLAGRAGGGSAEAVLLQLLPEALAADAEALGQVEAGAVVGLEGDGEVLALEAAEGS